MESPKYGEKHKELTRRELQIAELIAWGAAKKEIPDILKKLYGGKSISVRTVENITRNIYEKLNVSKASELSAWYFCECHQVDDNLNPIKKIKNTLYSLIFLILLVPQTFDFDQDLLRPQRVRNTRVERVMRVRKKD